MALVTIHLFTGEDRPPRVDADISQCGETFIAIRLREVAIYLPGCDQVAASYARVLAAALLAAADEVQAAQPATARSARQGVQ